MDHVLQAKLLAYKAYKLGRQAVARRTAFEDATFVHTIMPKLEALPRTEETIRRRLFYTLILAELARLDDPVALRESAMALGQQLEEMGKPNPFRFYMNIIAATTRSPTSGNFGDAKRQGAEPIQDTSWYERQFGYEIVEDVPQKALGLSDDDLTPLDGFLQKSLREIGILHSLA
jgi:hypothetical protein